jgi:hypothetical protein
VAVEWWLGGVGCDGDERKVGEVCTAQMKMKGRKGKGDLKGSREGSERMRSIVPSCVRSHSC